MRITKQPLEKRTCPICGRRFRPNKKWQLYDRPKCNKAAFYARQQAKLRELEEIKSQQKKEE